MENVYGFWNHKYDFSELNKYNYKEVLKDTFKLDIKRVSILAMLFALEIVLTVINKYTLGFLTLGFFTIEVSFVGVLFIYLSSNILYASLLGVLANCLRLALGSDPVGILIMSLLDVTFLIFFATIFFFLKKYWLLKVKSKNQIKYYIAIIVITGLIATFITSGFALLYNDTFIFEMYRKLYGDVIPQKNTTEWYSLLLASMGVTIAKFAFSIILFSFCIKPLVNLINKHLI
ncbi:ECF transporter S component [Spiroplasma sp. BIUS-1]|uniref:ECF transporter S component n=1 Tax=Spiroplasma sp. BIUS-1 TaxID=216964 RepID=UPI001397F9B7|nr:ECF transporter S component [Spiroplasma sp. BIUS-1]QHX36486.1 hypothetical protein SBIUS_v1c02330 [Spiroplasma sp. BIUS-1]